jgi:hypothetical protein
MLLISVALISKTNWRHLFPDLIKNRSRIHYNPYQNCNKKREVGNDKNSYTLLMSDMLLLLLDEMKNLHLSMPTNTDLDLSGQAITKSKLIALLFLFFKFVVDVTRNWQKVFHAALWSTKQIVHPQFKASKLVGVWQNKKKIAQKGHRRTTAILKKQNCLFFPTLVFCCKRNICLLST